MTSEHDAHDRAFFAGLLVVLALVGTGFALAHRFHLSRSSQPGDACQVTERGGLVGFDAETGVVRWTNVIPPYAALQADRDSGAVHVLTDETVRADETIQVVRTLDPASGRVAGCKRSNPDPSSERSRAWLDDRDPLAVPIRLGDATIMKWGNGIRATDPSNTGIWGVEATRAVARIGDDLIVSTGDGTDVDTARIDLTTGEERWSVPERFVALGGGGSLVLTSDPDDYEAIRARDAATAEAQWSSRMPRRDPGSDPWNERGQDLGPLVVFPSLNGADLLALDSATGRVAWTGDGPSPGTNWKYSEPGGIGDAVLSPDGKMVIASVTAELPDGYD